MIISYKKSGFFYELKDSRVMRQIVEEEEGNGDDMFD